jgi:hypothetical protein
MTISVNALLQEFSKLYLRWQLLRYDRDLQAIARQRENDFHAERILYREMIETRARLQSL